MICCLNPNCRKPLNPDEVTVCQSCGAPLDPLLKGRYQVVQPIGQGGFGRTYLALDVDRLNLRCVIKQFSPQVQGTKSLEKAVHLFNQEAVRLNELGEHAQIPTLLAYFEQNNYLYLVQQFIEGENLLQELRKQGNYDEQRVREVLNDLLPVLRFIHQHQVIHRDITPMNILRRKSDGRLVLIDFGVAKQLNAATSSQPGTKIGTEGYSPIEQFRGGRAYPSSDLYSLGATCLHLMTLTRPDNLYDPLRGRWFWREYLYKKNVVVSDQLAHILDTMLQDLVSDRYQSADEAMRDLHADYFPTAMGKKKPTGTPSRPPSSGTPSVPPSYPSSRGSSSRQPPSVPPSIPAFSPPPTSPPTPANVRSGHSAPYTSATGWRRVHTLTGHSSWVTCVAMSPVNSAIASSSLDDTIKVWNSTTGELLFTLTGHTKSVNAIAISPHGKTLVSGSDDYTLKSWNLSTGSVRGTLTGHSRDVNAVAISPDGQILASGGEDRTVKLWRMGTGTLLRTLFGVAGMIRSIAISPDGRLLVSGGLDNKIKLWSLQTGEQMQVWTGHRNSVNAVTISPDSQILASGSKDKTVKLWNIQTGEVIHTLSDHARDVNALAITPDGKVLISGSSDATIKFWDISSGKLLDTLTDHSDSVNAIAISGDGKTMVSGSSDQSVKVWQMSL